MLTEDNFLAKIKVNGGWWIEGNEIKEGVALVFHTLLFEPRDWRPNINGVSFKALFRK